VRVIPLCQESLVRTIGFTSQEKVSQSRGTNVGISESLFDRFLIPILSFNKMIGLRVSSKYDLTGASLSIDSLKRECEAITNAVLRADSCFTGSVCCRIVFDNIRLVMHQFPSNTFSFFSSDFSFLK